jgi:hypothetical protein
MGILWLSEFESSFSNLLLISKLSTAMGAWATLVQFCLSKMALLLLEQRRYWNYTVRCLGWSDDSIKVWYQSVHSQIQRPFLSVIDSLLASSQAFCYEMKVVQAFSWALFIGSVLALYVLFTLVGLAQRFGRYYIWSEPIRGSKSEFKILRWRLIFFP